MNKAESPLKLAFHGMNHRFVKTMMMFLQGPCEGIAVVVNAPEDADIDVYDADTPESKELLTSLMSRKLLKPVIVLSLQDYPIEGALHLQKPVNKIDMQHVLAESKKIIANLAIQGEQDFPDSTRSGEKEDIDDLFKDDFFDFLATSSWDDEPEEVGEPEKFVRVKEEEEIEPEADEQPEVHALSDADQPVSIEPVSDGEPTEHADAANENAQNPDQANQAAIEAEAQENGPALKTFTYDKSKSDGKYHAPSRINEDNYNDYFEIAEEYSQQDTLHLAEAKYNPDDFFQGFFDYAWSVSRSENKPIVLETPWCPIALFPQDNRIWFNASEFELNAFAASKLRHKTMTASLSMTPLDFNVMRTHFSAEHFQCKETFVWKLACWASKGKYPQAIDFNAPVYLKQWPNFTRLLITPHALRIAALLIRGPRTMSNVAEMLNIKPQYVFMFVSAAYAVGLAGQSSRMADLAIQPAAIQANKSQGLLARIISKLKK